MSTRSGASAVFWFLIGTICAEYLGIGVGSFNAWLWREFGHAPPMKIDLQATMGCPGGSLADLKRRFSDPNVWLERGAGSLFICADAAIDTTVDDGPRRLAKEFPGCLNYITGSLRMLRASEAICALPDKKGYVCNGLKGTESQGTEALGSESSVVGPCSPETLKGFGFGLGS